jgi:hypothetical protein
MRVSSFGTLSGLVEHRRAAYPRSAPFASLARRPFTSLAVCQKSTLLGISPPDLTNFAHHSPRRASLASIPARRSPHHLSRNQRTRPYPTSPLITNLSACQNPAACHEPCRPSPVLPPVVNHVAPLWPRQHRYL